MNYVCSADIPEMLAMFDENLGEGYMSAQRALEYINDENELFYAARREDGSLCGILLFGQETPAALSVQTHIPEEELVRLARGKALLKCRCICIAKDRQHDGLGHTLMEDALRDIRDRGRYGLITALLWKYNGKIPALGIFEGSGFRFFHEIEKPWRHLKDYRCIVCHGRCLCDGSQYVLTLE